MLGVLWHVIFIVFILIILLSKYSAMCISHFSRRNYKLVSKKVFSIPAVPLILARTLCGAWGSSEQVPSCLTCLGETEADRRKGAGKGTSSQPTVRSCKRTYSRGDGGIFLSLLESELHPGRLENEWVHVSFNDE